MSFPMKYRRMTRSTSHFSEWKRIEVEQQSREPVSYRELIPAPSASTFLDLLAKLPYAEALFFLFGYYLYRTEGVFLTAFCWYLSYRLLFPFKPREVFILSSLKTRGFFKANGYKIHVVNWNGTPILVAIYRAGVENLLYHLAVTYRIPAAVILRPGDRIHSPVPLVHYKVLDLERVVKTWGNLNPSWERVASLINSGEVRFDTIVNCNPKYYLEVPSRRNIKGAILAFFVGCCAIW